MTALAEHPIRLAKLANVRMTLLGGVSTSLHARDNSLPMIVGEEDDLHGQKEHRDQVIRKLRAADRMLAEGAG
jgi:hypothetical protein